MEKALLQKVKEQLLKHEWLELKPFRCPAGKLTIVRNGFQMDIVSSTVLRFGMTDAERLNYQN